MKKSVLFGLTALLTLFVSVPAFGAVANPTPAKVLVNADEIELQAYEINGYTYFKLRDIDRMLDDTAAGFELRYNSANDSIYLYKGPFFYNGPSIEKPSDHVVKTAIYSTQKVYLEDERVNIHAYSIDGYNYFKLRDLSEVLGFTVEWNSEEKIISITSEYLYVEDTREYADRKKAYDEAKKQREKDTAGMEDEEGDMLVLINRERELRGLRKLKKNDELNKIAELRAEELEDYFHHIRPDGTRWYKLLEGMDYDDATELIAYGSDHAASVLAAWMDYQPDRGEILEKNYEEIGVGYDSGEDTWTVILLED